MKESTVRGLCITGGLAVTALVGVTLISRGRPEESRQESEPEEMRGLETVAASAPELALAEPPPDRVPMDSPTQAKVGASGLHRLDFRDPQRFIASPVYNPDSVILDAQLHADLEALLREIDTSLQQQRTRLHGAAAKHMHEVISLGLASVDPGDGSVDRMGNKELRVFTQYGGQQYFMDFSRGQFSDLDMILDERDRIIEVGDGLIVNFFSSLSLKVK